MAIHSAVPGKHFPSAHPTRKHKPGPDGHVRWLSILGVVAIVAVLGIAAMKMLPTNSLPGPAGASPEVFAEQMERAAQTSGVVPHVFGGTITVERKGNQVTLTAEGVPPTACVSVGWKLVRKGLLTINGTTPLRVSAAKLSELCNQEDGPATLVWVPKPVE
ncbi:MAG: hypothetical protein HY055_03605 [Magnetospirillum sp.]|nr:hypothetical protein [Magnetospirillum sp.]